jgi:polyketide biosynthesis enoyl-CoA hydratase PksI
VIATRYELVRRAHGVATLQIATDEMPHVGSAALTGLADAVAVIRNDPSIRALVLEGGERHFCSGATRDTLLGTDAPQAIARLMGGFPRLLLDLEIPTLAAIAGHAVGGGLMLGLWCDVAVLAEESLYGANFLALGFTPGMGSTLLLEEVLGAPLARDMMLTGRLVKGRDIREAAVPLSHAVAPRREVLARTIGRAEEMASMPPTAMRLLRRHIADRRRAQLDRAIADELAMHTLVFADDATRQHIEDSYPNHMEQS